MGAGALLLCLVAAAALSGRPRNTVDASGAAVAGEARTGAMTSALPQAVRDVQVIEARVPGRPLVVIDAGHGGDDPGAPGVSGTVKEKEITLQLARELKGRLAANGRVRIALTRAEDRTMDLASRAAIARRLGADLFVSLHADSAPNPAARGASIYSVSEVASDADAARFAAAQNGSEGAVTTVSDGSVRALLADLAARDEMTDCGEKRKALNVKLYRRACLD